jgi:membrane protein DedA with SNARE-associated domain
LISIILAAVAQKVGPIEVKLHWVLQHMDIGTKGYFVLFGLLFSCGLGVPIPEDIPLLVAGALVGSGHMQLLPAAIVAWCGIIGGDCVLYLLGHHFGLNITKVPVVGKHVTKVRILRAEKLFEHYGIWVVAVGRLFAGIRGAMVIAAGTIRYHFGNFLIADGLAAVVSGGLFIFLGMKFGQHLHEVAHAIHHYGGLILAGVVVFSLAFILWKVRTIRKEKAERAADEHADRVGALDPKIGRSVVQVTTSVDRPE